MCFNKYKYKCIWYGNKERLTLVYRIIIDWSLQTNCIDILISSLLFDFNNDVLINSGVDQVRKLVKADKMAFIVLGFITRYPFRAMRRMLLFWPTDCRKRQSPVLCLHTPFPHGYTVSRGGPIFHEFSSSAEKAEYRELSVFNRVDGFLSGDKFLRYF